MADLYSNENFPLAVVGELRRLGHDVLTSHEAGQANKRISDDAMLQYAVACKRIVLTLNRRDFIRLHNSSNQHCGIVVCTADTEFVAQARRIHETLQKSKSHDKQLFRVNRPQRAE